MIAEVGTSIYGSSVFRKFERSSAAHNSLQLGIPLKANYADDSYHQVNWIEPVDVWSAFVLVVRLST